MDEDWVTSWYWRRCRLDGRPPSEPQDITDERASGLLEALDAALSVREPDGSLFLALAHARLVELLSANRAGEVRVGYRVAPKARFSDATGARGPALRAMAHVTRLEARQELESTRGAFHLSEVIAQGGLALITVRTDLMRDGVIRLGTYVPVAFTRSGGGLEPMRLALADVANGCVVWASDQVLSRAWHAPLAGGEILSLLPALGVPARTRSGAIATHRPVGAEGVEPSGGAEGVASRPAQRR